MSSKRYFVDKTDHNNPEGPRGSRKSQVGGGSKTPDQAAELRQRMRGQQEPGSSASFSIRTGRKS